MIEKIISDCEQAIEHGLYFAALNLALTLPDICAKAKYPNETSNRTRYIAWYDEYIGQYEKHPNLPGSDTELAYPSGSVIYNLRCSMLHQGNPSIDEKCPIDRFSLVYETKKPIHMCAGDMSGSSPMGKELKLSINVLCWKICTVVKKYYEENKELFNFFNYRLINWDEVRERQNKYNQFWKQWKKGENDDQT